MKIKGKSGSAGFTLVEVVLALSILAVVFGGIITASVQTTRRAEWSGYSLAAQALANQILERARSAKWDVLGHDEMASLQTVTIQQLDVPIAGTNNIVYATNFVTITTIPVFANPPASVRMVRVDTVWPFMRGTNYIAFTNTIASYFAPDI